MEVNFRDELIPAIIQDAKSGKVLMLGYMNDAAWQKTLNSGNVTFYSRSRKKLWTKGEESGHRLSVSEIRVDCDADAILIKARLSGPGCCHEGYESCFYRRVSAQGEEEVVEPRQFDPNEVYKKQ